MSENTILTWDDESDTYIVDPNDAATIQLSSLPKPAEFFFHRNDLRDGLRDVILEEGVPEGKVCVDPSGEAYIYVSHYWSRNNWNYPLNMRYHMDLMYRLLEFREREFNDISEIEFDDICVLNFNIHPGNCNLLSEVFSYGIEVLNWIDAEVNKAQDLISKTVDTIRSNYSTYKLVEVPSLIDKIKSERDKNKKGLLLEELMAKLFNKVPGFEVIERVRTKTEEIDVFVSNCSADPFWSKESPLILIECKNWSSKCGKDELVLFRDKIKNRRGRAKLGFFISWNGFKRTFNLADLRTSQDDILIVPLDGDSIIQSVNDGDFGSNLKTWINRATLDD